MCPRSLERNSPQTSQKELRRSNDLTEAGARKKARTMAPAIPGVSVHPGGGPRISVWVSIAHSPQVKTHPQLSKTLPESRKVKECSWPSPDPSPPLNSSPDKHRHTVTGDAKRWGENFAHSGNAFTCSDAVVKCNFSSLEQYYLNVSFLLLSRWIINAEGLLWGCMCVICIIGLHARKTFFSFFFYSSKN